MEKNDLNKDELEIIRLAASNDRAACSRLFERYNDPVYAFILGIIPQPQDAEDICQETFDKAFRNIGNYNTSWAFSTWLFTIAQNTAYDFYRKKMSSISQTGANETGLFIESIESGDMARSPEDNLITQQTFEQLIKAIKALDIKYRKAAELRFIHDYAYEEIAKELKLPINTVKTHINRARKLLAEKWKS